MQDLQEVTHEVHYESYRSEKLGSRNKRNNRDYKDNGPNHGCDDIMSIDKDKILKEKEEEVIHFQNIFLFIGKHLFKLFKLVA